MKTYAPLIATAVAAVAITGCTRSTEGSVAMTTEPGPPINRTVTPSAPRLPFPFPIPLPGSPRTTSPRTPGSTDPQSITCNDYLALSPDAQLGIIESIVADGGSAIPQRNAELAKSIADALCTFLPDAPVSSLLLGGPPR